MKNVRSLISKNKNELQNLERITDMKSSSSWCWTCSIEIIWAGISFISASLSEIKLQYVKLVQQQKHSRYLLCMLCLGSLAHSVTDSYWKRGVIFSLGRNWCPEHTHNTSTKTPRKTLLDMYFLQNVSSETQSSLNIRDKHPIGPKSCSAPTKFKSKDCI